MQKPTQKHHLYKCSSRSILSCSNQVGDTWNDAIAMLSSADVSFSDRVMRMSVSVSL